MGGPQTAATGHLAGTWPRSRSGPVPRPRAHCPRPVPGDGQVLRPRQIQGVAHTRTVWCVPGCDTKDPYALESCLYMHDCEPPVDDGR